MKRRTKKHDILNTFYIMISTSKEENIDRQKLNFVQNHSVIDKSSDQPALSNVPLLMNE